MAPRPLTNAEMIASSYRINLALLNSKKIDLLTFNANQQCIQNVSTSKETNDVEQVYKIFKSIEE